MDKKEWKIFLVPLIISLVCFFIFNNILKNEIKINNFDMISNNCINFISILVGFLITTISIVIGFFDKKIIKVIVKEKKEKVLFLNWFMTIFAGIASAIALLYVSGIYNNDTMTISKTPLNIFICLAILFLIYLIFSLLYFLGIANSVMKEEIPENGVNEIDKDNIITPKSID